MAEARGNSQYVNTMNYFIDYYGNYNEHLKEFDYDNFFNTNEIQNTNCFIQIKIDHSMTLYFIKEELGDSPIGAKRFYNTYSQSIMERESYEVVTELTEGKTDITYLYDDINVEFVRGLSQQDSEGDNYPLDSWGPPPLMGVIRSQSTIQYDTHEEVVPSTGWTDVNRQINFDTDNMTNQIIHHIHSINSIRCPVCRCENTTDKCVDIKGSGDICSICLDNKVEIFFIGCGHAVTCKSCFEQL